MHLIILGLLIAAEPGSAEAAAATPRKAEATTADQDPSFEIGAQTEVLPPVGGVSSLMVGYDAVKLQIEVNLGAAISDGPPDIYALSGRLYVPVHRGKTADFAVGVGAGLTIVEHERAAAQLSETLVLGARVRIFVASNVAISGAIGATGIVTSSGSQLLIGARPLGTAGFNYYFR